MRKPRRLYLGMRRDRDYELGSSRKGFSDFGWAAGDGFLSIFCQERFELITGIKLQPGEVRRVRRILIELED